ncbi:MAG: hypothetical protein M1469_11405 [Bacteroidetes bacterium]|nr:hypothetical protein [Bacteroidota bacterium]
MQTSKKKYRLKMKAMNEWLRTVSNVITPAEIWRTLKAKLVGHYRYYGISGNYVSIANYYHF